MKTPLPVRLAAVAAAGLVLALLPFRLSGYHQGLAVQVAVYFLAVLGLNIVLGYTGQVSIGQGGFMAIGGYTLAIASHDRHWSVLATLPLAVAITFAIGVAFGLPALRLSGHSLAKATIALAISVPQLTYKFSKFTGGENGIQTSQQLSHTWLYAVSWSCAALALALAWMLLRGRTGRAFRSIRDNPLAAASSGVSLRIYKTLAFGVSAAYAGLAGALFVLATNGFATPGQFGLFLSIKILIGAVVGGLGSLWGVLLGAAFVGLMPTVSTSVPVIGTAHGENVVFGLAVILIILLFPSGVAGVSARIPAWARLDRSGSRGVASET